MNRLRWLARTLNPFQPIRDYSAAAVVTTAAGLELGLGIHDGHPVTVAIGAAMSLLCPFGPLVYGLYRRVRVTPPGP